MKISRKGIEWIYLHDKDVTKVIDKEQCEEIYNKYQVALDSLLQAVINDETVDIISEKFYELDEVDGERLSYVELISYIKGFEMCMKLIGKERIKD